MSRCTDECVKPNLGTRTQHCVSCHQTFTSTGVGDRHRTGQHGVRSGLDRRRCKTVDEMLASGLKLNRRGIWQSAEPLNPYWDDEQRRSDGLTGVDPHWTTPEQSQAVLGRAVDVGG